MALAQDTPILLLDEPTTYLDLAHQLEVLDLLADLNARGPHDRHRAARPQPRLPLRAPPRRAARRRGPRGGRAGGDRRRGARHAVFGLDSRVIPDPVTGTPMCVPIGRTRHTECRSDCSDVELLASYDPEAFGEFYERHVTRGDRLRRRGGRGAPDLIFDLVARRSRGRSSIAGPTTRARARRSRGCSASPAT